MANSIKRFFVPVVVGFILHVATYYLNSYLFSHYGPSVHHRDASDFFLYTSGFFNLLHTILPGLAVGLLAKSKPAVLGFVCILVAQLFIGIFWQAPWYDFPSLKPLLSFGFHVLPIAIYGLFSSLAGFAIKNNSNYAIKVTSE